MSEEATTPVWEYIGLGLALVIIILIIIPLSIRFLLPFLSSSEICDDGGIQSWNKLKPLLKQIDSETDEKIETEFINGECSLITFSPDQSAELELPEIYQSPLPELCLCKIEGNTCEPHECYRFSKIKSLTRFSSQGLPKHTFLNLGVKKGILTISHPEQIDLYLPEL